MLSSFLGFILVISIIVFIHELGHYLAARICGVRVEEFSIGFGRTLLSYKDSIGTTWKISMIPLGGYVKMFGDKGVASESSIEELSELSSEEKSKSFTLQSPLRRAFIAIAGPLANYVLALAIFSILYVTHGKVIVPNVVGEVQENSPAYNVGIKQGDRIKAINGNTTNSFEEIYSYVSLNPKKKLKLEILRHEQVIEIDIITGEKEIKDSNNKIVARVGILGIKSEKPKLEQLNIIDSAIAGVNDIILISRMTFIALVQIFAGDRSLDEIRGTISIAEQSGSSLNGGVLSFVMYIAMISINVGFVNLLPVPVLDGGHIVLCLYELVVGRRPGPKIQAILNGVGLVFIIFLFLISTSNDIKALLSR